MLALVVTDPDTFRTGGMSGYRFHCAGVGVLVVAQIRWLALLTSRGLQPQGLRPPRALPLRVVLPTLRAWVTHFPKI